MTSITRRSAFAVFAAALAAPVLARAQGSSVGPAGAVPSTTAPSNSDGTPAGGSGVIGTTRYPAAGQPMGAGPGAPLVGGTMGTSEAAPRHRRRRRHRSRRHTTPAAQ